MIVAIPAAAAEVDEVGDGAVGDGGVLGGLVVQTHPAVLAITTTASRARPISWHCAAQRPTVFGSRGFDVPTGV